MRKIKTLRKNHLINIIVISIAVAYSAVVVSGNRVTTEVAKNIGCPIKNNKDFIVYDATLFNNKPDIKRYGLHEIEVVYVSKLWPDWHNISESERGKVPEESRVKSIALELQKYNRPVVLDIEHWKVNTADDNSKKNIRKFVQVVKWMKVSAPELKIGYFGVVPVNFYSAAIRGEGSSKHESWQKNNESLKPIAEVVDMFLPSTYTYRSDINEWKRYAIESIKQARKLADKPVYIFLWPNYEGRNNKTGYKYITDEYWRQQLETAYCYADGAVVWGGWSAIANRRADWDNDSAWWKVLSQFMTRIGAVNGS